LLLAWRFIEPFPALLLGLLALLLIELPLAMRYGFAPRKRRHLHVTVFGSLDIHTREHRAQILDRSLRSAVLLRDLGIRNTFNDEAQHLVIREDTALPIAQFAHESPEIHRKMSVVNQLSEEDREFLPGSDRNTMHHADRSKLSDVHVVAFRLLDAV